MARGNPDNLRAAAQRKRQAATQRAETTLDALIRAGDPITFRGLAKAAGVSDNCAPTSNAARPTPSPSSNRHRATSCARSPPS